MVGREEDERFLLALRLLGLYSPNCRYCGFSETRLRVIRVSMDDLSLSEVRRLVAAANAARSQRDALGSSVESDGRCAERELDALFRTSHTLAVDGTLAPGQPNHHVLAPLGGEWTDGLIEGDLLPAGWGAALGYPGFRPRVGGAAVAVQVLTAPLLATA